MLNFIQATRKRLYHTDFSRGFQKGIPIALGYIPVSFTFGLVAVKGGLPAWTAITISLTNLTSAGQFAGTNLIIAGATLLEIALTTLIINIRYMLMSLSLSQKIVPRMPLSKRLIMAFGVTDETFTVASLEEGALSFSYMAGLISGPYLGWAIGTTLGAFICSALPVDLQNSMGIALYAMFIALIIPGSKKSRAVLTVVLTATSISALFAWAPYLNKISEGWGIIITTIMACLVGAALFPREDE